MNAGASREPERHQPPVLRHQAAGRASFDPVNPVHRLRRYVEAFFGQRACLLIQADSARSMGSPFVAEVLEAAFRQLDRATRVSTIIDSWPGDTGAAAVALRLNAGLHALSRTGRLPYLTDLFGGAHRDFDGAISLAFQLHDDMIAAALSHPTQTNEVGRTAAIYAALARLATWTGMPCELFELGSSSGLNLNLASYGYRLGGVELGDRESKLQLQPEWDGRSPPAAPVQVANACGVDLSPMDPTNPQTAERLMSFVFADQPRRLARLSVALQLAKDLPPCVEQSSALPWVARKLAAPQADRICRVVFHSMVLQYFADEERDLTLAAIEAAGCHSTQDKPLAHIAFEWTQDRSRVELSLRMWPWNYRKVLAICHPYGDWISWLD